MRTVTPAMPKLYTEFQKSKKKYVKKMYALKSLKVSILTSYVETKNKNNNFYLFFYRI